MEGYRTVVLLPPIGSSEYDQMAEVLISNEARDAKEILLIPLGFHSNEELSHFKATIRYPEEFFDRNRSEPIDSQALRLARIWYRPLGDETVFNGINLAQMCEYSFYFIFVDCLRSIDIAKRLLEAEETERLVLPQTHLTTEISEICYESLPNAIELVARKQGITVERIGIPVNFDPDKAEYVKSSCTWDKPHVYERFLEIVSPLVRGNAVFFQNVYGYDGLALQTNKYGLRPLRIIPYRRSSAKTREFSDALRFVSEGSIKKLISDQNDIEIAIQDAISIARERLTEFLMRIAPMMSEYVNWAGYYSRKMRPKVLVNMEDITPVNRCIARVLREGGAQVVILQHGLLTKDMAGSYLMPIEGNIQAVWGRYFVDWHTSRGKDPNTLRVTGAPNYEGIQPKKEELVAVKERLGLEADRPILLIGTSRYSGISSAFTFEKEQRFFDSIYCGLAGQSNYQIATKMHPSCGKAYYEMAEQSVRRYGMRTVLTKDNLRELLTIAQVVVIPSSTIGYEAVLLSKPLVCVDFETQGNDSVFVCANVAIGVEKASELVQGIEAAINLTKTREYEISRGLFIENHLDGNNASSRIADLINELYNKSKMDKGIDEK